MMRLFYNRGVCRDQMSNSMEVVIVHNRQHSIEINRDQMSNSMEVVIVHNRRHSIEINRDQTALNRDQ